MRKLRPRVEVICPMSGSGGRGRARYKPACPAPNLCLKLYAMVSPFTLLLEMKPRHLYNLTSWGGEQRDILMNSFIFTLIQLNEFIMEREEKKERKKVR